MKNHSLLISVIVPLYNKENYLNESIDSVINQSYSNIEIIIVDDCSTDGSFELAKALVEKDERIKLFQNQINSGGNVTRNKGFQESTGEYIIFFDADDLLKAECIQQRVESISKDIDGCVSSMGTFYHSIGDNEHDLWTPPKNDHLRKFLNHSLPWSIMQPIWRREFLEKTTLFNTDYERLQDVEFHTRLLLQGAKVKISQYTEPDCFYRIEPDRHSVNRFSILSKWVNSGKLFVETYKTIENQKNRHINGTLIELINQIKDSYSKNQITKEESIVLTSKALNVNLNGFDRFILKGYSLLTFSTRSHIKGLKKITRIITGC